MTGSFLAELLEGDAEGELATTYADIRATLGFALVPLVYRHLATRPGRLEAIWAQLRPTLVDAWTDGAVAQLVRVEGLPRVEAAAAPGPLREAVEAYMRSNPRNLLAVHALLSKEPRRPDPPLGAAQRQEPRALPPAPDPERLAPDVRRLLEELSRPFADGEPLIVPTLFRHFAGAPELLALVRRTLEPAAAAGAVARAGDVLASRAAALAPRFPYPPEVTLLPEEKAALRRFSTAIARMIVAGLLLREAL